MRERRKDEHIEIARALPIDQGFTGLEHVHLIHNAVPELNAGDIDLRGSWQDKTYQCPLVINAITGGTVTSRLINRDLSYLAAKHGLIMAVGSQTVALHNSEARASFTIVRKENPRGIIWANVSAHSRPDEVLQAVEMIDADGLQLHLNVPQELAMLEGDRDFAGTLENITRIKASLDIPVMAKEVGFGLSREAAISLYRKGIKIFDIGGKGGTNFLDIEGERRGLFAQENRSWGLPTAISLAEIIALNLPLTVIATGGIRSALDGAKVLAMGADLVGMAGTLLKVLHEHGREGLDLYLTGYIYQLKAFFLMTGARNAVQIREKPVIITRETAEWLRLRGIEPRFWSDKSKESPHPYRRD